jgi:hypothetical protein
MKLVELLKEDDVISFGVVWAAWWSKRVYVALADVYE